MTGIRSDVGDFRSFFGYDRLVGFVRRLVLVCGALNRRRFARFVGSFSALVSCGALRELMRSANLQMVHERGSGQEIFFDFFVAAAFGKVDAEERFVVGKIEDLLGDPFFVGSDVRLDRHGHFVLRDGSPGTGNEEVVLACEAHRAGVDARANAFAVSLVGFSQVDNRIGQDAARGGALLRVPANSVGWLLNGEVEFGVAGPGDLDDDVANARFLQLTLEFFGFVGAAFLIHFIYEVERDFFAFTLDAFDKGAVPNDGRNPDGDPFKSFFVVQFLRER